MFLVSPKMPETPSKKLSVMLKMIEKKFGEVPPHFLLIGELDPDVLEDVLAYLLKLTNHPSIEPDLFIFIRLHVAQREGYSYCIDFNRSLLKKSGYSEEIISSAMNDISTVPFGDRERLLVSKAIKAIYNPSGFSQSDLQELYSYDWSNKEIFTAIDHAGFLLKSGRIISCYLA